jgi:hypothetical protein
MSFSIFIANPPVVVVDCEDNGAGRSRCVAHHEKAHFTGAWRDCGGVKGARAGIKLLQRGSESAVSKYGGLWGSPDEILSRQTFHRH